MASVKQKVEIAQANVMEKDNSPKRVLVIGASTGYGLSSRIAAAHSAGADTLGVYFERPPKTDKPASAGYYNSLAFHKLCEKGSTKHLDVNGDCLLYTSDAADDQ